ncbi:MAG: phytoene desaturase family protein [Prevotella sp.]
MKKCVIIGSGLGGLSTAVILARNGYQVTVLEQGVQVGGCLQCFSRGGTKFETGMHFIGSAAKGQTLNRMMRYLHIDDVPLKQLDTEGYDVVKLEGGEFCFANGRERFIDRLAECFPRQRENLQRYFDIVEQVAQASSLHSLRNASSDVVINTEYQCRSVNEVVESLVTDPLLQKVLVGNLPLYAAEPDRTPFSTHAFIADFYNQSAFRIVGGSDAIAGSLVREIEKEGGSVVVREKAVRIECDNSKATAVITASGNRYEADMVISAIHPARLVEMLADNKIIRPVYRQRINAIPNTVGGFAVYVKFKPLTMPYMNHNVYGYNQSTPWNCEHYNDQTWPKGYLYMHLCTKDIDNAAVNGQAYAEACEVLSYMQYADVERWAGRKVGCRGSDYEAFKREHAERLIDAVDRQNPGFKDSIEKYWTSTPLTYRDYTGTEGGSMYGVAKDINNTMAYRVQHRTRIPNLLLTGQNINSHGMLGVLVGTIVTCSELLTAETIYKQIKEEGQ